MKPNTKNYEFENMFYEPIMGKLMHEVKNTLIRASIDVSHISDPMSRISLKAGSRRSFRAIESNDIVPCSKESFKDINIEEIENIADVEQITSSSSSSSFSSSSTPEFPSVILVFNTVKGSSIYCDDNDDDLPRISKMFYTKPRMEIIDSSANTNKTSISSNEIVEDKPLAYDNALSILKRYNLEKNEIEPIIINEIKSNERPLLSSEVSQSSFDGLDFLNEIIMNDNLLFTPTIKIPCKHDKARCSFESKRTVKTQKGENFNPNEIQGNKSILKDIADYPNPNLLNISNEKCTDNTDNDDISYSILTFSESISERIEKEKIVDFLENKTENMENRAGKNLLISSFFPNEITLPNHDIISMEDKAFLSTFEESREKLVTRIMTKMTEKKSTNFNSKELMKIKESCNFQNIQNETGSKFVKEKPQDIKDKRKVFFESTYTENISGNVKPRPISHFPNLITILSNQGLPECKFKNKLNSSLNNGDVIVLRKDDIVNVNDIVDSISSTIILRDLGVLMISEKVLINNAIEAVKLKSKRLKTYMKKKYLIFQDFETFKDCNSNKSTGKTVTGIKKRNIRNRDKRKQELRSVDAVLNLEGLLKSLTNLCKSESLIKKSANIKDIFRKIGTKHLYDETLKNNLNSLKNYIKTAL